MNEWVNEIAEAIEQRGFFQRNERIMVAVSGGLDSMVLLALLHTLSKRHRWKICVGHFNHQLRGRSSNADENLVKKTAAGLKLKFVGGRGDVKTFARQNGVSIEMAARKLRHEFLAKTAKKLRIKTIALAHHADDQVELFFLRLLRGAGTAGLSGMDWASPSPADASIRLVRPLLGQTKELLRDYAETKRIRFREDASNLTPDFQRNRIRNDLIPVLESLQPAAKETILRTMEIAASESEFVLNAAREWLGSKRRPPLLQLHVAVQRVCLQLQIRALGYAGDFDLIEKLREKPNCGVSIDSMCFLSRDVEGTVVRRRSEPRRQDDAQIEVDLSFGNRGKLCRADGPLGLCQPEGRFVPQTSELRIFRRS